MSFPEFTSYGDPRRATSAETDFLINPLNAELNPICHLLALLGAHHILHISRIRVNPMLKRGAWFQEIYVKQDKICIHKHEQFTNQNMTRKASENLRGSYFLLNCGWVTCIITCNIEQCRCGCTSPQHDGETNTFPF